jgi:hypothetical protein
LKPACRRPISDASSTAHAHVGVAVGELVHRPPQGADRPGDRDGGELGADEPVISAIVATKTTGATSSLGALDLLPPGGDEREHEDRHARAQQPGQQQPRPDPERARVAGRAGFDERKRHDRPRELLGDEEVRGRGDERAEEDRRRDLDREVAVDEGGGDGEERDGDEPARERDPRTARREADHEAAILVGRRAAGPQPVQHRRVHGRPAADRPPRGARDVQRRHREADDALEVPSNSS